MEISVKETLKKYCELEMEKFISSSIFSTLNELVKAQEFNAKIEYGKAKEGKDENLYLSLSVYDKNGELIEIFDEGYLTTATMLVLVDKKERCKFFPWQDNVFIDDLNWIIKQLNILINKE
jgi:hypothetical protein